jgi:hypothetical protein
MIMTLAIDMQVEKPPDTINARINQPEVIHP